MTLKFDENFSFLKIFYETVYIYANIHMAGHGRALGFALKCTSTLCDKYDHSTIDSYRILQLFLLAE